MSIEAYIKSRAAFVAVEDELNDIMRMLDSVSNGLRHRRQRTSFKGTATALPEDAVSQYGDVTDAAAWPSAERIMERLALWHSRRAAVVADWAALDKDDQSAMKPPPEGATGNPTRY